MAMAAKLATLNEKGSGRPSSETAGDSPDPFLRERLFEDVVDYIFGRNSWGVSFLFSPDLPNSVQNIYSPMVHLLGIFPKGAFSEGPGSADTHQRLSKHFSIADDDPFHRFNTSEGVFFDNATDFMCQEATIIGQVNCLLLLTLATMD
jgi:hypothetical protein